MTDFHINVVQSLSFYYMCVFLEEESNPDAGKENPSLALDQTGNGTTFRKLRFRYKGAQSEGNRYIKNMQL